MFRIRWITPDENWSDFLGDAAFHTVDQAADRATQLWANGSASQEDTLQVWQVEDADHNALVFPGPVLSLDEEDLEVRAAEMAATAVAALRWY